MTIATLIITCVHLRGARLERLDLRAGRAFGRRHHLHRAANAGNTSQDLKTGYIVGATPIYQQIGLAIGVITSSFVIGYTLLSLHQTLRHRIAAGRRAPSDA